MEKISLNGVWTLKGRCQDKEGECISLNATVPGCVQLDLSGAGYLPEDLFMGENILEAEKYENYEWWYERSFTAPKKRDNAYLVFEGVDCLAEYFLNGKKLGESENMFIAHEFKVTDLLKDGENTLTVHIKSAMLYANEKDYSVRFLNNIADSVYLRKPPHSFGWDIMPRAVTAGIWRDVRLEVRDSIYFDQLFYYYQNQNHRFAFYYTLNTDKSYFKDIEVELDCACGQSNIYIRKRCRYKCDRIRIGIANPKLWFPYGYGEPNVYDGKARIYENGVLVHEQDVSLGLRDVQLDRRDPEGNDNGQFRILINGVEIMCKGSNWVPLDAFHSRDAERYDRALALVKDVGCNILRCWGGNVYEDHRFFDFCDRNGIMVWQDFAMACCSYPEDDDFLKNMKKEVISVVRKLRNHPSIVIWAGDNEVDAIFAQYNPNENRITRQLIPSCIRDNDMGRPYLPSSPYISERMYSQGVRSQVHGSILPEDHLWGPRDYFKSDFYANNKAHFVSETGYHGCPSLDSIKKFITPERVWPYTNNPEWTLHSSDQNGNDSRVMLMEKQVRQLFGSVPTDPEEYVLASQISQAEAKKFFLERIRVNRPDKTGIIWWNLLDGWPQMSDAVVDYYFTKKLAYHYIKRSQPPFAILAGEITSWNLPIYACNDTPEKKSGRVRVIDTENGKVIYEADFTAAENASTKIASIPLYYSEQKILIFEWETDGVQGFNHYLCGFPPFSLESYKSIIEKYKLDR